MTGPRLTIILLFFASLCAAQLRDTVRVKTQIYEVVYSETKESPIWIKYKVLCTNGTASRKGMDFYLNDSIHTSNSLDYINNEYDKGHMAPAADFNCTTEMLYLTFSYLNCALQNQYLNRGTWRFLEAAEREWSREEPIIVTIEVKFNESSKRLASGALVPAGFTKTILFKNSNIKKVYYFPNSRPFSSKYSDFLVK